MSAPGELIAQRYRLKRHVGAGGMGVVWEAFDERLHRTVALKALHPQPWLSDAEAEVVTHRALREARITARLNHPHAVPVYDVVEDQGRPCLVMQFLHAEPLSSVLQRRGPLSEPEVAELGAQLASALEAAHKVGIVHRDVKPGNVLIAQDGTARISDFGIAHALGDVTLTATGLVAGTPEYLAPEVAQGHEPGFPADVFSLGATLYAALEGRPPFGTDTNRIALLHRVAAGVINAPQRSGAVTSLLADMLAAEPRERPTMSEVAARLVTMRDDGQSQAPVPLATAAGTTTESTGPPPTPAMSGANRDDPPPTVGMPAARGERLSPREAPRPGTGSDVPATRRQAARQPVAATATASPPTQRVTAPPSPPADSPSVTSSRHALAKRQRRRSTLTSRARATAVVVTVLVLLVPLLLLIQSRNDAGDVSATAPTAVSAPGGTTTPTSAAPTVAAAPPGATPSPASPAPASSSPTTSAPSAAGSAPPSVAPAGLTAADSVKAVTSYYSLLPTNTDRTWPLMTASYQAGKAGGRASYQRFWDAYSRVTATDVSAVSPSTVEATITYYAKDGRVVRERTSFGLVNDGGVVKIDTSRVLSSSSS